MGSKSVRRSNGHLVDDDVMDAAGVEPMTLFLSVAEQAQFNQLSARGVNRCFEPTISEAHP
jgi:hypothetical protein